MRRSFLFMFLAVSLIAGFSCGTYDPYPYAYPVYATPVPNQGSLTVSNQSYSRLTQLHFTLSSSAAWGPNVLPGVLSPGEQTLATVDCGVWDVLVGDEFGRQCVLPGIQLCQTNEVWVVYEDTLRTCSAF